MKKQNEDSIIESFLKSWDIYRKLPKELVQSTTSGATISIITIGIIMLLWLSEFSNYWSPQLVSDLQVDVSLEAL